MRRLLTFLLPALLVLTLLGFSPRSDAAVTTCHRLCQQVNTIRVNHGLRRLHEVTGIDSVALRWAKHMRRTQTLAHNPHFTTEICCWRSVGEIVGEGPSRRAIMRAFMHSPEHRAIILDHGWDDLGAAGVTDANGVVWVVIDFRQNT